MVMSSDPARWDPMAEVADAIERAELDLFEYYGIHDMSGCRPGSVARLLRSLPAEACINTRGTW